MSTTYELATKLANDMAEDYIASNLSEMMIPGGRKKAAAIRKLSEDNTDQMNKHVQEYRSTQRIIYSSLYDLIEGYKGYKIVEV